MGVVQRRMYFLLMAVCLLLTGCGKIQPNNSEDSFATTETVQSRPVVSLLSSGVRHVSAEESDYGFSEVELLLQNPELPNGCEVTSLAMVLAAAGYPVDNVTLYEQYLPTMDLSSDSLRLYGPDPEEFYAGDAASESGGWYCFERPIMEAGNAFLSQSGSKRKMVRVSGLTKSGLDHYAELGIPLIIWVTIDYEDPQYAYRSAWTLPDGSLYVPYRNLHCVVLAGEEDGKFRIADPIEGWTLVDKDVVFDSFESLGRRAVTIGSFI